MAYPSHVAARDVSARSGAYPRTLIAGCALAALTAAAAYSVSPYIDLGDVFGRPATSPAPAVQARMAQAEPAPATPSLFDPRLSLGVGAGFVPPVARNGAASAPRGKPAAMAPGQLAAAPPLPAARPEIAAKPAPLADETAEADIPTPVMRPATPEIAAAEPEAFTPVPPRRPSDLAALDPAPRVAARPAPALAQPAPAPTPSAQAARVPRPALAPRFERTDHLERLLPGERMASRVEPAAPARARILSRRSRSVVARASGPEPSFFQKLFGGASQPTGALAYAPTTRFANDPISPVATASIAASARRQVASLGSDIGVSRPSSEGVGPRLGGGRAIYDISAQAVILPDGTRLEAHSGLGPHRDSARSAHIRMRGVTPPHVYNLKEREALFHGVRAIRMHPVGGAGAIHGRTGLLAHTYMLGPNGDSNGCVSIRNYNAFLNAYLDGKINQLVVVESMGDLSSRFALR